MIPYGRHHIDQQDIDAVVEVLKSDWLTTGPLTEAFEKALAAVVSAPHAIACSNGTTALHLALLALGVGPGDTVLVPAITFLASANAARYVGADVVFVDVDARTGLMTAETLEAAILANPSKKLTAVINVHFAGQCEDLAAIQKVAKKHGLWIVEDAAHAVGTVYQNQHPMGANAFCDVTTFSFHPVKTISMGEGGAITTASNSLAEKLRAYRSHGMIRDAKRWQETEATGPWYYEMHDLGYNYRASDIHCALGLSQLKKLPHFKAERAAQVARYDRAFAAHSAFTPLKKLTHSDTAWHLYVLQCVWEKLQKSRSLVMQHLQERHIGTQVHYIPVYRQPYYQQLYGQQFLPGAEAYYASCLSLPLHAQVSVDQQTHIIHALCDLYAI